MNDNLLNETRWRKAILQNDSSIKQAISNLDQNGIKIILIVNEADEFQGTISDGDIRRGLLRGLTLDSIITTLIHRNALVAPPELGQETVKQLMVANKIQQIPVINESGYVVGIHLWDEMETTAERSNLMVIMAGGMGTRMRPHSENCPKPLLPVAGKPILEHIIERAKLEGFTRFVLSVHYLGHMIEDYFGDGKRLQVKIEYLHEDSPLGTAGALASLNPRPDKPFVVTNGDVITDIPYGEFLDFHILQEAAATMAIRVHEWQHPFGVVQIEGVNIIGFEEKPVSYSHINGGVYVIEPDALSLLEPEVRSDMPSLFEQLKLKNRRIVAYPMHEPWLDVGRPEDLLLANGQATDNR